MNTLTEKQQEVRVGEYEMTLLLAAYRAGYFHIQWQKYPHYVPRMITRLVKRGLIFFTITSQEKALISITDLGVEVVKDNFARILANSTLRHLYPVLMVGDKILVSETLTNGTDKSDQYVRPPHLSIAKGNYRIGACDRFTLLLVSDDTQEAFRVRMFQAEKVLFLKRNPKLTASQELNSRLGKISMKTLLLNLHEWEADNLTILSMLEALKKSKAAEGRISYAERKAKHLKGGRHGR